jgi:hypothetical protein
MFDINYLAVLVAGIANMVVGYIWYGPLFGKMWMEGRGMDPNNRGGMGQGQSMAGLYIQQFIAALIMAYVFAHVFTGMNIALDRAIDLWAGIQTGFFLWLGFALPIKYADSLWSAKKFKYVAIDLGYWLVVLVVMGIVLSLM